ncbi:DsrE family protein [Archaeoglobus neptunius]|uniref:DsrE family protein n=1 Tax=Archaeoglobus neptunius TaxID=2798580 RepID=UPI001925F1F8|nr:DsrE family protein [Archaeoglobus neptunius]
MKALFHVDFDSTSTFELALANIENFIKDVGDAEVAVVANGYAVKLFVRSANPKFAQKLVELNEKGVRFYVCNNALNLHGIDKENLFEFCEVVPAGVTKIVELQNDGFAYIKP